MRVRARATHAMALALAIAGNARDARAGRGEDDARDATKGANVFAVLAFTTMSAMCALMACYLAMFYDRSSSDVEEREKSLREEVMELARYARGSVASVAKAIVVSVQRVTHGDDRSNGDDDGSWKMLSDTNPLMRWVKRHAGEDEDEDEDRRGEPFTDDDEDDDYYELMAEHEGYSEYSDYVASSAVARAPPRAPRTLEEAENANDAFVPLPTRHRSRDL